MLPAAPSSLSRGSDSSLVSSLAPISRQGTMSSYDGTRSMRQSKRMSVTALYLSMSQKDKELEIEDDLAKGVSRERCWKRGANFPSQYKRRYETSKQRYRVNQRRISFLRKMFDILIQELLS